MTEIISEDLISLYIYRERLKLIDQVYGYKALNIH